MGWIPADLAVAPKEQELGQTGDKKHSYSLDQEKESVHQNSATNQNTRSNCVDLELENNTRKSVISVYHYLIVNKV